MVSPGFYAPPTELYPQTIKGGLFTSGYFSLVAGSSGGEGSPADCSDDGEGPAFGNSRSLRSVYCLQLGSYVTITYNGVRGLLV